MRHLNPASIQPEAPDNSTGGVPFMVAAGRWCLWPISGAGADMLVCGEVRDAGCSYCKPHRRRAVGGPAARPV